MTVTTMITKEERERLLDKSTREGLGAGDARVILAALAAAEARADDLERLNAVLNQTHGEVKADLATERAAREKAERERDEARASLEKIAERVADQAENAMTDMRKRVEMVRDGKSLHSEAVRVAAENAALRGEIADARTWVRGDEKWQDVVDRFIGTVASERARAEKAEASAAVMREALEACAVYAHFTADASDGETAFDARSSARRADAALATLATDAGKALLEERDRLRAKVDAAHATLDVCISAHSAAIERWRSVVIETMGLPPRHRLKRLQRLVRDEEERRPKRAALSTEPKR